LLAVHGWPLDHRVFEPQSRALSSSLTIIAHDRRGFGKSDAPPDLRLETADIDRILDALDLESVHLLGMSQGGRIALRYAVSRPHRLRSLILQGAAVDGLHIDEPDSERIPIAEYANLAKSGGIVEVRRRWREHPMMRLAAGCEAESRLLAKILADYSGADLNASDATNHSQADDVFNRLDTVNVPILLITGARETAARKQHAEAIRSRVANCVSLQLENSGHLSNLTEPDRYNHAVLTFCEKVEATRVAS
jgi:pimeloyl-ACP methyl ester carboxylesterase